jgi:hypothetical protein
VEIRELATLKQAHTPHPKKGFSSDSQSDKVAVSHRESRWKASLGECRRGPAAATEGCGFLDSTRNGEAARASRGRTVMRMFKFVAPALTAVGLLVGASAQADDPALKQLVDFYCVNAVGHVPGMPYQFCVVSSTDTTGMFCTVSVMGMPLVGAPLMPGFNYFVTPDMGATTYTAGGVGIEPRTASNTFPDNPGIN